MIHTYYKSIKAKFNTLPVAVQLVLFYGMVVAGAICLILLTEDLSPKTMKAVKLAGCVFAVIAAVRYVIGQIQSTRNAARSGSKTWLITCIVTAPISIILLWSMFGGYYEMIYDYIVGLLN